MIHPSFLLYCCKTCSMGTPITNCCYAHYPRRTAPMHEPTQESIVSALRHRVRASIADLTQVLGLQCASMIPQEIQRRKASGLVVYDEPLGPYSVISLPGSLFHH